MRQDNFPHPVSDTEVEGVPEYADDDSTAWDDVHSPRDADGPDPAPLPADHPVAVDRYGTTPEEARRGEPIDYKLAREQPDEAAEATDRADADEDEDDEAGAALALNDLPIEPDPGSPVSVYDRPDLRLDEGRPIGRLVEPDEGAHPDEEPDAIAYDAGAAGGGPTAEEAAMHEVEEP